MIGEAIGQYKVTGLLGAGGMGEVFLAEDTKLRRKVALKFLPAGMATVGEARERFAREARAQAALNHPHVATIHDVLHHENRPFIVMEFIDGEPLREYCRGHRPPLRTLLKLGIGIAEGLEAAHRAGIVHRDLKPANILVTNDGRAKICDFGLALARDSARLTRDGSTLGTAAYMSPEQAQGREVDSRSDLFSFGAVFYEMVTETLPFPGEHEAAIIYAIVNEEHTNPRRYKPDLPDRLVALFDRMLAKEPNDRFSSATELIRELRVIAGLIGGQIPEDPGAQSSIAVLPFTNMSADPENEYFSDGLAEELLNGLAKIPNLQVAARTSSFAFKGAEIDIREIGRRLGVATVLEGSVRRSGNRLRVTAQLIKVADGYHLWSERYDREMDDVFAIQDEISESIVSTLKIQLLGEEKPSARTRPTDDVEAYNLYLQGRYFWSQRTEAALRVSIERFEGAIARDKSFALAHVGLADSWSLLCSYQIVAPSASIPQAREAAQTAMRLAAESAEAFEASAHVRILDDWSWSDAEREFRRAVEINPGYATARQRLALLLTLTGRVKEAAEEITRAQEQEPLSLIINSDAALIAYIRGEHETAIGQCRRVLDLKADFPVARLILGLAYEQIGDYQRAVGEMHRAKSALGDTTIVSGALGHCYGLWGDHEEARMLLDELQELSDRRYVSPYTRALIHIGLNQRGEALAALRESVAERSVWMIHLHLAVDPRLASLRDDPAFAALIGECRITP